MSDFDRAFEKVISEQDTGLSEFDQAFNKVSSTFRKPQSTKDRLASGVLTAANSALFGWGDEIGSAGAALVDEGLERLGFIPSADYQDRREDYQQVARDALGQFREEQPGVALGLEIGGGLASGGLGAAKTGVFKAPSLLQKVTRGAAVGGAGGALAGAGYADDESRALGAAQGGAIGAVFGGGLGGVSNLVGKVGRSRTAKEIRDRLKIGLDDFVVNPERGSVQAGGQADDITRAQKSILKIFEDATDDELIEATRRVEIAAQQKQPLTIFEALDQAQGYADAKAIRASRGGRGVASRFLQERRRGAVDRLNEALDVIAPQEDVYTGSARLTEAAEGIVDRAKQARAAIAKPYYDKAVADAPIIDSPVIDDLLQQPKLAQTIDKVQKEQSRTLGTLPKNHFRVLDAVKKELDDEAAELTRAGRTNAANNIRGFKRDLTNEIDEFTDAYGAARREFAAQSNIVNWLEGQRWGDTKTVGLLEDILTANPERAGASARALMRKSPKQLQQIADVFKASGRELELRSGIRAAFQDVLESRRTGSQGLKGGSIVDRLFGEENLKSKLDNLIGEDEANKLWRKVDIEGLISKGEDEIGITERAFGSPTTPTRQILGEQKGILQKILRPGETLRETFESLKPGENEKLTKEIAEELFTTADPKKWKRLLQVQKEYNAFARGVDTATEAVQGATTQAGVTGLGSALSDDTGAVTRSGALSTAGATGALGFMSQVPTDRRQNVRKQDVSAIEARIDQDPIDAAIYETESGRNPKAKNPNSSAAGGFQLIKATQESLGVTDPYDLGQSYDAYLKLRDEYEKVLGSDPVSIYAGHYLGSPLAKKYFSGARLTEREKEIIKDFETKALPRFQRIYDRIIAPTKDGARGA